MKSIIKMHVAVFLTGLFLLPVQSHATTIVNHNFNDGTFGPLYHESFWSVQSSGGVGNTPAGRLTISQAGTPGKNMGINLASYASNEFWIELDVKIEGSFIGGSKFIKFFGDVMPSKNNMTVGVSPDSLTNTGVGYNGDSLCANSWNGPSPYLPASCLSQWEVKAPGNGGIDLRGGTWKHYKVWVKRATPGTTNGEIKVWWNGTLWSHIKNMNSNPSGVDPTPGFDSVVFGSYTREYRAETGVGFLTGTTPTYYIWMDNLYIGTTEKSGGSTTQPPTTPPTTTDTTPPAVPTGLLVK